MKCNKQLKYSNYVAFSHFHGTAVNNSGLVYNNCYCKITYIEKLSAFVIESADNLTDAMNGVLEDGDLYYMNISEDAMLHQLRRDVVAYYMD